MRPADRLRASGPEPFGNCPARDRSRKSQAAAASPDIPAAYPQKRRSGRSMRLRMPEGLQLKSRGFLSKAARAEAAPRIPWASTSTVRKNVKNPGGAGPVMVVDCSIFCQVYQAEGALYASRAGKGRSPGGTR